MIESFVDSAEDWLDRSDIVSDDSVDSEIFHKICDMDVSEGQESFNVIDLSDNVSSDSDDSVNSELFNKVCDFDQMLTRQIEDFSTPKRKIEEDSPVSPNKSQRLETSDSPD